MALCLHRYDLGYLTFSPMQGPHQAWRQPTHPSISWSYINIQLILWLFFLLSITAGLFGKLTWNADSETISTNPNKRVLKSDTLECNMLLEGYWYRSIWRHSATAKTWDSCRATIKFCWQIHVQTDINNRSNSDPTSHVHIHFCQLMKIHINLSWHKIFCINWHPKQNKYLIVQLI